MFELLKAVLGLLVLASGWVLIQSLYRRMESSCGDAPSEIEGVECLGCSSLRSCLRHLASNDDQRPTTECSSMCDRGFETKEEGKDALN